MRKGRVPTANGNGLRNAIVSLADSHGGTRPVITSAFGYYRFDDVLAGEAYVIAVSSKRFAFAPRVISVIDELTDVDFTAEPAWLRPIARQPEEILLPSI